MSTIPATNKREMVSVNIRFTRDNMETFEAIVAMYKDSEDAAIRRIATVATRKIGDALAARSANHPKEGQG